MQKPRGFFVDLQVRCKFKVVFRQCLKYSFYIRLIFKVFALACIKVLVKQTCSKVSYISLQIDEQQALKHSYFPMVPFHQYRLQAFQKWVMSLQLDSKRNSNKLTFLFRKKGWWFLLNDLLQGCIQWCCRCRFKINRPRGVASGRVLARSNSMTVVVLLGRAGSLVLRRVDLVHDSQNIFLQAQLKTGKSTSMFMVYMAALASNQDMQKIRDHDLFFFYS